MGLPAVDLMLHEAAAHYNAGRSEPASVLCGDILGRQPDHLPALHLAAVIALANGRNEDGQAFLGRLFGLDPDYVPGLVTLGDALSVKGEHEAAVATFARAAMLRPKDAALHAKIGVALSDLARFAEAEAAYREALALDPDLIQTRFNLGVALMKQQQLDDAERAYRAVLARAPDHAGAWVNLGNVLADQDRREEAVEAYHHALVVEPDGATLPVTLTNLAACLLNLGRTDEAIAACERAIAHDPAYAPAYTNLGAAFDAKCDFASALAAHQRALALHPSDARNQLNVGTALRSAGHVDEAVATFESLIARDAGDAAAYAGLGAALGARGDCAGAIGAYRQATTVNPDHAQAYSNLAVALRTAGQLDEALAASTTAVALDPTVPEIRFNHAQALLLNGHLAEGFDDLRWCRQCRQWRDAYPEFNEPEWQGEAFADRTLLLYAEAGFGDTLQFIRYAPMAAARGGTVIVQVQPALVSLLRTTPGVTIIAKGEPLPPFDLQLPLMRLPHIFGTTLETIPADVPYLIADAARVAEWRRKLNQHAGLKVGVVWCGNPSHKGDRYRSLAAADVLPRLVMPGVQLCSLQKEPRPADLPVLAQLASSIIDLGPDLSDFADTAAAIAALDLVISVDTSVAHLAGALGRPTWLLLPYALDWRWLRDREDSPWYPTMRLFRQERPQAWDGALARAAAALSRLAASHLADASGEPEGATVTADSHDSPGAQASAGNDALELMLREAAEHYNAGRAEAAEALCGDILAAQPDHLPALHLAAVIAFAGQRMAEGAELLGRLFDLHPDYGPGLVTLGDVLAVKGDHEAAAATLGRAAMLRPHDATLHAKLGVTLSDLSRFDQAEAAYRCALGLDPNLTQARFNLGVALMKQKRPDEAELTYRAVLAQEPRHHGAWLNLGNVLNDLGRRHEAVDAYHRALAIEADGPSTPVALTNLAACLIDLGRIDDAMAACREAIAQNRAYAPAYTNLGVALEAKGDGEAALTAHQQALALDPGNLGNQVNLSAALRRAAGGHAAAYAGLGAALGARGDATGAIAACRQAIAADPDHAEAHSNLSVALHAAGELDEAFAASCRAVALAPGSPDIRFNHAHVLLMNGRLAEGFDELRWGRQSRQCADAYPDFTQPEWQGEPFDGRTLLLFAEAGLGDVLQFARYAPMAAARGGTVVMQVQPTLLPLLGDLPNVTVIAQGQPLPAFDLQLPLMRLPHVFGTTLETIPAAVPYVSADPARTAAWRQRLGDRAGLKVGLVWAGNPRHKDDRDRSLAAADVLPRLVIPGVQLYSLQKEPRAADLPVLAQLGSSIIDLGPQLSDFADTAAAIAALDLVISVDTSVAHLAGAMGRPTWLLLPHALDWRWLRDREDSPWYPTMRLFRQARPQAWDGVLQRVAAALAELAGEPSVDGDHGGLRAPSLETHGVADPLGMPDDAETCANRAVALHDAGDIAAALPLARRAAALAPSSGLVHGILAGVLMQAGEIDAALAASHRAVALAPDHAQLRCNHAHLELLCGDLVRGFSDYRARRDCFELFKKVTGPEWRGEPFAGRTLLLYSEQGMGDVLQMVRYLPMVIAKGGTVVLHVQQALVPLLSSLHDDVVVVARGAPLPPLDLQLPLMDLPHLFGTTLDSIPAGGPYLHADPDKVAAWRRRLGPDTALKVGVVWAGSPTHAGDRYRSLAAAAVLPRLIMPGVQLYSLQKEPRAADQPVLAQLGGDIVDLGPELDDFADTAAAITALDLVISVDTSVVHLAGALGRPAWVLLPYAQDWRWLRDREDSPWYPSLRLFRQQRPQAWDGVLTRVTAELERVAQAASRSV